MKNDRQLADRSSDPAAAPRSAEPTAHESLPDRGQPVVPWTGDDIARPMTPPRSQNLARTTFQLLTLGALIATSFWIMRPFLIAPGRRWITVATWPLLLHVERWCGGRRLPAAALMTTALVLGPSHR